MDELRFFFTPCNLQSVLVATLLRTTPTRFPIKPIEITLNQQRITIIKIYEEDSTRHGFVVARDNFHSSILKRMSDGRKIDFFSALHLG